MDEPACEFDGPWKEALEWFFEPFLAFFFPAVHADVDWSRGYEFLDKELQKIVPEAEAGRGTVDKLAKVWTRAGEETWVLVHVEVQSQYDAGFPGRMYAYNHRLADRYGRMPVSLAVLGDDGPGWRPAVFQDGRWGCEVRFTFPAVKLLDYRGREATLEADGNPFSAVTLAHLKTLETRGDVPARQGWKLRLVKGLYARGLTREQVIRLFRLIDWMMTLPPVPESLFRDEIDRFEKEKDMPFIAPIEQLWLEEGRAKGHQEGRQEGRLEGRLEGRQEGLRQGIQVGLQLRFGQPGLDLIPRVQAVTDTARLEAFLSSIASAPDLDALRHLLPSQD